MLSQFNWTQLAFVYTSTDNDGVIASCNYFAQTFDQQSALSNNITETYIRHAVNTTVNGFEQILKSANLRARIIVSCLEMDAEKRNYMRAAINLGMITSEYVHIFVQTSGTGFGFPPYWESAINEGKDDSKIIQEASKSVLVVS